MYPKSEYIVPYFLISICNAVWSQDITQLKEYGCQWYGGASARVSCKCQEDAEMTIKVQSIPEFDTNEIHITGCKLIKFQQNSVSDMKNLRTIHLNNIDSIIFEERSLNWYGFKGTNDQTERFDVTVPSLNIFIDNSTISLISSHAFAGRIGHIVIERAIIEQIQPLAFDNLMQTETLAIRQTEIKDLGAQAFKKFTTEYWELSQVTAGVIPSRAFSNIDVYQNASIAGCVFHTVRPGAFTIDNAKVFQVTDTNISRLDGEGFKIYSKGVVIFRHNYFGEVQDGAFGGITLQRDAFMNNALFLLESNTFGKLSRYSLAVAEPSVHFRNVYMSEPCDCTDLDHKIKDSAYYSDFMCMRVSDYVTVKEFKDSACSVISDYYVTIIVACVVSVALVAVIAGLGLYYKFVYRSKKYGGKKRGKNGTLSLIVPDGRTYRETELHVIVEKTDLLTTDL